MNSSFFGKYRTAMLSREEVKNPFFRALAKTSKLLFVGMICLIAAKSDTTTILCLLAILIIVHVL
jgi:hypothetical protein